MPEVKRLFGVGSYKVTISRQGRSRDKFTRSSREMRKLNKLINTQLFFMKSIDLKAEKEPIKRDIKLHRRDGVSQK